MESIPEQPLPDYTELKVFKIFKPNSDQEVWEENQNSLYGNDYFTDSRTSRVVNNMVFLN